MPVDRQDHCEGGPGQTLVLSQARKRSGGVNCPMIRQTFLTSLLLWGHRSAHPHHLMPGETAIVGPIQRPDEFVSRLLTGKHPAKLAGDKREKPHFSRNQRTMLRLPLSIHERFPIGIDQFIMGDPFQPG